MVHSDGSVFAPLPVPPRRGQRATRGKSRDSRVRGFSPYSRPASTASTRPPTSAYASVQGSPVAVPMMLEPLIGPLGREYVDRRATDDLTREMDRRADMVYDEYVEERNQEVARYNNSGPDSEA